MTAPRHINNWKESVKRGGRRLAREFEENPVLVIGVCAAAIGATAKLIQASSDARRASVWKREVLRRERMSRR